MKRAFASGHGDQVSSMSAMAGRTFAPGGVDHVSAKALWAFASGHGRQVSSQSRSARWALAPGVVSAINRAARRFLCLSVLATLTLLALSGTALAKPGTPGPAYFAGTYERIGRSGGATAELLNDRVAIEPLGQKLGIRACAGPEIVMGFGPAFEVVNLMTGTQGDVAVDCLFHNNGYNRPVLTCRLADGAAFTLWPLPDKALACNG